MSGDLNNKRWELEQQCASGIPAATNDWLVVEPSL